MTVIGYKPAGVEADVVNVIVIAPKDGFGVRSTRVPAGTPDVRYVTVTPSWAGVIVNAVAWPGATVATSGEASKERPDGGLVVVGAVGEGATVAIGVVEGKAVAGGAVAGGAVVGVGGVTGIAATGGADTVNLSDARHTIAPAVASTITV